MKKSFGTLAIFGLALGFSLGAAAQDDPAQRGETSATEAESGPYTVQSGRGRTIPVDPPATVVVLGPDGEVIESRKAEPGEQVDEAGDAETPARPLTDR